MAESFSVKAILSAVDSGFSSVFKTAMSTTDNLKNTLTSGIGFGALMSIGSRAVSVVSSGVSGLIGEIDSSNAAWKTFTSNMQMVGKSGGEIESIKKELQEFAEQSIYSSSDMASTFSQLEAVGTKNTTSLVKGFGGLAAAAENPQQAMKTLSQQATQMAAKPMVAWMDFKLMLEQTPAGIAAVAKEMGMTTAELVTNVQDGTVATEDFFDAITKVGTNDAFTELATSYKSVGQAMDGLQETLGNKLAPAFDILSQVGIDAIDGIISKLGEVDAAGLASKVQSTVNSISEAVSSFVSKASGYWTVFKENADEVGSAFGEAFSAIGDSLAELTGAFGSTESIANFGDVIGVAKDALVTFAGFMTEHASTIATVISKLPQLFIAYKGFQIVKALVPGVGAFTSAILKLAVGGVGAIAQKLFGIAGAQKATGAASAASVGQVMASAAAVVALGAGIALAAAGFAILAQSAIALAGAGPLAIGVMIGMVAAVAGLAAGAAVLGPALSAGAVGFVAFGAAVLLAGTGMMILSQAAISLAAAGGPAIACMAGMIAVIALLAVGAAALGPALLVGGAGALVLGAGLVLIATSAVIAGAALNIVALALPMIVQYGLSGAVAIAALGASMLVFGAGAAVAGAGALVLGAGLVVLAAGLTLAGAAALIAAAGILAMGAGALVLGAGLTVTSAAVMLLGAGLPLVASGALASAAGLGVMLAMSTVLMAAMLTLTAAMLALTVALVAGAVAIGAFGVVIGVAAVGAGAMALALLAVNSSMKSIADNAKSAQKSITSMVGAVDVVNVGLDALGDKAQDAVKSLISAFTGGTGNAKSAGRKFGDGVKQGVDAGLKPLPDVAKKAMTGYNAALQAGGALAVSISRSMSSSVVSALRSAASGAYSCGANVGAGFANGMAAYLGRVRSIAAQLAAAAEAAIRAKAQIHSPSRISDKLGQYWGKGYGRGLAKMFGFVFNQSEKLVAIPALASGPDISSGYRSGTLSRNLDDSYSYNGSNPAYTFYIPLEIDGKKVGSATATYTQAEIDKQKKLSERLKGNK